MRAGTRIGRGIMTNRIVYVRFHPSAATIRRWSREAKRRGRTPNVAYFAARYPKQPSHKQKVLARRWRSRGDTWWDRFEEAVRELSIAFGQVAHAITTTAGTNLYRFEVPDGR